MFIMKKTYFLKDFIIFHEFSISENHTFKIPSYIQYFFYIQLLVVEGINMSAYTLIFVLWLFLKSSFALLGRFLRPPDGSGPIF